MNPARIVVLIIALGAGGVAAYLASGSDKAPSAPVAQLQTVDVLVAKSDIGLGQAVTPGDVQWQTWPAATASNNFIRRNDRPEATTQIAGSIARDKGRARDRAGNLGGRLGAVVAADKIVARSCGRPGLPLQILGANRLTETDVGLRNQNVHGLQL